jgi:hypothetical protein
VSVDHLSDVKLGGKRGQIEIGSLVELLGWFASEDDQPTLKVAWGVTLKMEARVSPDSPSHPVAINHTLRYKYSAL